MALREIAAHFGFTVDKGKLDEADKAVTGVKKHAEESTQGVGLLVEAFGALAGLELVRMTKEWVVELANVGDELADNAEATGLSTRQLQIWQLGAAQAGEDASTFVNGLRALSKAVAGGTDEAGTQAKTFADMGIKTKNAAKEIRPLGDLLPEIAEHFHNMSDGAAKSALAQSLFGKSGTKLIPLLNQGAAGVAKLSDKFDELGGGFDEKAIERAGEMKVAIANVDMVFTSLKSQLALAILPRFQTLLEYIQSGVGALTNFAHETTLAESAVGSLSSALAVTLGAALLPYLGGALKFGAIYLAVDDLKAFLEGNGSIIGDILDSWFGDGTAVTVREWCLDAFNSFTNTFDDMKVVLPVFSAAFMGILASMDLAFGEFTLGLQNKWNGLVDALGLNDRFKLDTTVSTANVSNAKEKQTKYADKQYAAEQVAQKYAKDSTPLAIDKNITTASFKTSVAMAPAQTSWNMVQNAPQININVASGTPQQQTEALGRQTREALRDSHRQALQALENRGGK